MTNLDRFSRPLHGETYFDEPQVVCQCEQCGDDLYEGDDCFEASDGADCLVFCTKDCFIDWAVEEHEAGHKAVEVN